MSEKKLKKRIKNLEAHVADLQAEVDQALIDSDNLENRILQLELKTPWSPPAEPRHLVSPPITWDNLRGQ